MGLFDTIHCEYPLPDTRHQDLDFQTKDLDCFLAHYTITPDGRLIRRARRGGIWGDRQDRDVECPMHGDIQMYTSAADKTWIEYVVRFTHGRVEWIRPFEEEREAPEAVPPASDLPPPHEPPASFEPAPEVSKASAEAQTAAGAEEALLHNLRRDKAALEKLLQENSDHWGYEDSIYRFYHQSFKVYGLQHQTQSIVDRLQALAPDRPLNRWFLEIVRAGTGKAFKIEDNARWTEVTRPILEAFFHARFFLEMAARYAGLDAPPQALPSGYAALLYLFGLR